MKSKKILWSVLGVLVVLIVAAVIVVALNLDRIVKAGVEAYGPKITGVPVQLDAVHIGLLTGSASVNGLVVGNPAGYKSPQAISVGKASVGVNPFSILSDKIVVRSVRVESPQITFEGGFGGNNLSKIMDNVNASAKSGGPVSTNSAGKPKASKKLEVDDFVISGAKVSGSLTLLDGKEIAVKDLALPDIHLTNLGTGRNGITAADLTQRVLSAISVQTMKSLTQYAADAGGGALKLGDKSVNQIKKGIGNLLNK